MYAIYGNIYHQYTPNVSIYTSTMDPMGYIYIPLYPQEIPTANRLLSAASLGVAGSSSNVCHGLLRSTALRCGEARAVASIGIHRAAAQDLVVFPAESMGFTWIQWGVYIDVPGWWFQPCFIFHNI